MTIKNLMVLSALVLAGTVCSSAEAFAAASVAKTTADKPVAPIDACAACYLNLAESFSFPEDCSNTQAMKYLSDCTTTCLVDAEGPGDQAGGELSYLQATCIQESQPPKPQQPAFGDPKYFAVPEGVAR